MGVKLILMEMAQERKIILYDLRKTLLQRLQNLFQIFLFRDNDALNHWIVELRASCWHMNKCKSNKKYLPEKVVFNELFDTWADSFDNIHKSICEDVQLKEKLPIPKHSCQNLFGFIHEYHVRLAHLLTSKGEISTNECSQIVNNLLIKYPLM